MEVARTLRGLGPRRDHARIDKHAVRARREIPNARLHTAVKATPWVSRRTAMATA